MHVLLHVYARSVCPCMFMYVTFAVNAMRIFGNNQKTISQKLWNRIIGKIMSIIASGLEGREESCGGHRKRYEESFCSF